jgi:hypothetical protein
MRGTSLKVIESIDSYVTFARPSWMRPTSVNLSSGRESRSATVKPSGVGMNSHIELCASHSRSVPLTRDQSGRLISPTMTARMVVISVTSR